MTDRRIAVAFNLFHPTAETDTIRVLVEKFRVKAIDLGFVRVGDVVSLSGDEEIMAHEYGQRFLVTDLEFVPAIPRAVIYFVASLADSDPLEIGLANCPTEIVVDGIVVPFALPQWSATGATRTRDLKTLSKLLHHAAEIGVEAFFTFAGVTLTYRRDDAGVVRVEQEWDDMPDEP